MRKFKKKGGQSIVKVEEIRINHNITAKEVRLIGEDGNQKGIVGIDIALSEAEKVGLDLVEVAPNSTPPVCKIMDFGKLKYDKKKKEQESKKKQHVIRIKEVRFRPRISGNDFETKIKRTRKFLDQGFKVKITVMFRGRELTRVDLGEDLALRIEEALSDVAEVEKRVKLEGNRFSIMMAPK